MRIRPVLKPYRNIDSKYTIKIRITHKGIASYLSTPYRVEVHQYQAGQVVKHPNASYINIELRKLINKYEYAILRLGPRIEGMTSGQVVNYLKGSMDGGDLYQLIEQIVKEKSAHSTIEKYRSLKSVIKEYSKSDSLNVGSIDQAFIRGFEYHLNKSGRKRNTTATYLRTLKTVINRAIDYGYMEIEHYPFRRFRIQTEPTMKRFLTIKELKSLIQYDGVYKFERDIFFLSIYLVGINMKDLLTTIKEDNGRIVYRRSKTRGILSIKIEPEAMEIFRRWCKGYRFPQLSEYKHYTVFNNLLNRRLKKIARACKIEKRLSTYYARHTWATIASSIGVSRDVIAEALGHQLGVTDIYIKYDQNLIDRANRRVINEIVK